MKKLSIRIKADGQTARHAEISGDEKDQEALVALLDEVMPDPHGALALLRSNAKAQEGWYNMRVIGAGMRRAAGEALGQWEGEDRELSEEEQQAVKKLLQEIIDTTWPLPGMPQPMRLVYPDKLSLELDIVLGFPNFKCGQYARVFRAAGYDIPTKAEREQAFVIHWLTKLVLEHGDRWAEVAQEEFKALVPAAAEQEGAEGQ